MKFKMTDKGPKLDEKKVTAFESRHGFTLPDQYRQFLLWTNGGIPSPDVSFTFVEDGKATDSVIDQFYMLKKNDDDMNLDEAIEMFVEAGRMPAHFLPFASDQFGNQLCLSLAPSDLGVVYFWNHEKEPEDGSQATGDHILRVVHGFDAFFQTLRPMEM